jgi:Ni,Fe-hydrogenase III component G
MTEVAGAAETERRLADAGERIGQWCQTRTTPEPNRLDCVVAPGDLPDAVRALHQAPWGYLSAITGLDHGPAAGAIEVLYHFCSGAAVVTLRVRLPRDGASVPSVCGVIPSASFFERELGEMLGLTVAGTPNPDRLFLPDDWPEGTYPLRKDFQAHPGAEGGDHEPR